MLKFFCGKQFSDTQWRFIWWNEIDVYELSDSEQTKFHVMVKEQINPSWLTFICIKSSLFVAQK